MELRSDIATAAARMTSAYDVNREIRQLVAYLREGETVQRLASGVYGAGAGLLAVTDLRVVLLRDGRSGQASEGFPLERLSTAEWVVDGGRGTITVSDSNSVAELREVALADGEEVVGLVRALMNRDNGGSSHPRRWPGITAGQPDGTRAEATSMNGQNGQNGHGGQNGQNSQNAQGTPAGSSAPQASRGSHTSPSMPPIPAVPLHNLPQGSPLLRRSPAAIYTNGAVPVTLLSRTGTIPAQQPPAESSAPQPTAPPVAPVTEQQQATQATPVTQVMSSQDATTAVPRGVMPPGVQQPNGTGAVPPVTPPTSQEPGVTTTMPPVTDEVVQQQGAATQTGQHHAPQAPEQLQPTHSPLNGRHAETRIGISPVIVGEVPVSQLAAEETATQLAVPPPLVDGSEPTVAVSAATTAIGAVGPVPATGTPEAAAPKTEGATESGERPQPIVWRVPDQTLTGAVRRIQAETEAVRSPRRVEPKIKPPKFGPESGRKKWVWAGAAAAAVLALAAVGGAKFMHQDQSQAAPVSPAPAAVDSPVGPKVTVTKVVDGDTVEVAGEEVNGPVEVLGIVAPRLDKNQCGAAAAKTFASHELANTEVTLVSDPSQQMTSRAGHRLAFLKLADGSDYSVKAAKEGMVRYYDSPQATKMSGDIKAAEASAQGRHAGLWGPPCNAKPAAAPDTASNAGTSGGANASPARTEG